MKIVLRYIASTQKNYLSSVTKYFYFVTLHLWSKPNFERKLAANIKQDNKSFFAHIRSKQHVKDMLGLLKDNDGIVITNSKEMVDALNIYFSSVFTLEDKNNLPVHQPILADNVECLTNMLITQAMIVTKIKKNEE